MINYVKTFFVHLSVINGIRSDRGQKCEVEGDKLKLSRRVLEREGVLLRRYFEQ